MKNQANTKSIKKDFNRLSEKLGCKARLSGNKKYPKFEMFTGEITPDGYEIVIGIDANKFGQLISNYSELQ